MSRDHVILGDRPPGDVLRALGELFDRAAVETEALRAQAERAVARTPLLEAVVGPAAALLAALDAPDVIDVLFAAERFEDLADLRKATRSLARAVAHLREFDAKSA